MKKKTENKRKKHPKKNPASPKLNAKLVRGNSKDTRTKKINTSTKNINQSYKNDKWHHEYWFKHRWNKEFFANKDNITWSNRVALDESKKWKKKNRKGKRWKKKNRWKKRHRYGDQWGNQPPLKLMDKQAFTPFKPKWSLEMHKTKKTVYPKAAIVNVTATLNNTILNISTFRGDTLISLSSGMLGLKNRRQSTVSAAKAVAARGAFYAWRKGIRLVEIRLSGAWYKRRTIVKGIHQGGLYVYSIKYVNSLAHNGCRKRKKRR